MKKVLFLIPTFDKGGAENVLLNLVNNMDQSKFDITVQTLFDQNSQKAELKCGIKYKSFLRHQFRGNSRLLSLIPATFLYRLIVKDYYDVVVSYLEGPTTHIISGCPYASAKKVAWIHSELLTANHIRTGFITNNQALKAYKSFDRLVFVSQDTKRAFEKTANLRFENTEVIYNVVNSNHVLELSKQGYDNVFEADCTNVISVGRLVDLKGYDRLIKVHKRLLNEGFRQHVFVLGTGIMQDKLQTMIDENGISETFTLLGFKNNPYPYIANADIFVCSSRREGISTVVTEALILGTPVVSTNCSGARELLGQNSEYGVVVDNSEEGIYEGLKYMLNRDNCVHYAQKALKRGKQFNMNESVKAVEQMIDNICK